MNKMDRKGATSDHTQLFVAGKFRSVAADVIMKKKLTRLKTDAGNFNFVRLRSQLKSRCWWMNSFLEVGGLEALFQLMRSTEKSTGGVSVQIGCMMCITAVLNSHLRMQTVTGSQKLETSFADGKFM